MKLKKGYEEVSSLTEFVKINRILLQKLENY